MSEFKAPATVAPHAIIPEKRPEPRAADDRRKEPRYPAKHDRANLGWYCGESYETLSGRLEDVSSGGASLVLEGATWAGGDVWLCLSGDAGTDWVRAEVVGASQVDGSAQRIRLKFHESCPFDFFKTAAWGKPGSSATTQEPASRAHDTSASQGPHRTCPDLEESNGDFRELRVSVTLFQPHVASDEPRIGRLRDDEWDDRAVLIPKACVAVVQLVGALMLGALIIIKLAEFWRLDAFLGLNVAGR